MDIIKIAAFSFVSIFIISIFKGRRNDIAILISIACGTLIFIFLVDKMKAILNFLKDLSIKANIDTIYLNIVFKVIGIAFITTFCSEICKDAGQHSLAYKVELSGKILILLLSIPILMAVLNTIIKII